MPFITEYCDTMPPRVTVVQDGAFAEVRLRKGIAKDAADGPDGASTEFWRAETLALRVQGSPTIDEVEADFDGYVSRALEAEKTDSERIAALEQDNADLQAALLELGDLVGGE